MRKNRLDKIKFPIKIDHPQRNKREGRIENKIPVYICKDFLTCPECEGKLRCGESKPHRWTALCSMHNDVCPKCMYLGQWTRKRFFDEKEVS